MKKLALVLALCLVPSLAMANHVRSHVKHGVVKVGKVVKHSVVRVGVFGRNVVDVLVWWH